MSAIPDPVAGAVLARSRGFSSAQYAAAASVLAVLGVATIWPTVLGLWTLWTVDALKSIGMAVPVVSLVLILRVWRRIGWEAKGTWWGLALVLATVAAVRLRDQADLVLVVSPQWAVYFPPLSFVAFAYASGVVLLFGGTRLYRCALFPIVLVWFVNPIPHIFNVVIDLPLQQASAHIARAFAMSLGYPLTPDRLRLMFTPDFGMFIAPGCNGIRGSVTMGFIALIAGYVNRFRWYANAAVVAAAILLGYVFNLLRLCILVLYYVVAMHFHSLQDKAETADYVIGAVLFLVATLLLFTAIHRLRNANAEAETADGENIVTDASGLTRASYARLVVMLALVALGCTGVARGSRAAASSTGTTAEKFPARIGNYALERTWDETLTTGPVVYAWAQYAPVGGGIPISVGVSPVLGAHDTLVCHSARGEDPVWQGQLTVPTASDTPVSFSVAFFNDGATMYVEASTLCDAGGCGEFATARTHFGFVYNRPDTKSLLNPGARRPIPVLLRVETIDETLPSDLAREQLTGSLRAFLGSVKLDDLTRAYSR
ncbi:MAG: exosortase J [Acidobacteriaceae bacterium]|jgi:exosortase J